MLLLVTVIFFFFFRRVSCFPRARFCLVLCRSFWGGVRLCFSFSFFSLVFLCLSFGSVPFHRSSRIAQDKHFR
uniref:Secreted protein n=1 Tax=Anopheles darlingi TaxID=43151 RepID=A0A2M4DAV8_ANODA